MKWEFLKKRVFSRTLLYVSILVLISFSFILPATRPYIAHAEEKAAVRTFADPVAEEEARQTTGKSYSNNYVSPEGYCKLTSLRTWPYCIGSKLAEILLSISAKILELSARLFNYMIDYTLNIKNFINKVPIVYLGWSTFRDFANIGFIFMILYIAINTILGNEGYGIKKLLGKTIIAAMLINFSLFFTNVIVDTSNIFALQFYNQIVNTGSNTTDKDGGISASFSKAMGLHDLFTKDGEAFAQSTKDSTTQVGSSAPDWNIIMVGVLGSVFLLITAFVFLAATGMFLYRSITLIFLMILSPLAFAGGILPKTQGYAKDWWEKLFNTAFYAPVYMALLYLVASMVLGLYTSAGNEQSFAKMIIGSSDDSLPILFNYVILNALMCGCIIVASKMGAGGSKLAMSWGKSIGMSAAGVVGNNVGRVTLGTTASLGRNTVGRVASSLAQSTRFQRAAARSKFGITSGALKIARWTGDKSFDVRNTGPGKEIAKNLMLGEGKVGGFNKSLEENKKAKEDFYKSLNKSNKVKDDKTGKKMSAQDYYRENLIKTSTWAPGMFLRGTRLAAASMVVDKAKDDRSDLNDKIKEANEKVRAIKDKIEPLKEKQKAGTITTAETTLLTAYEGQLDKAKDKVDKQIKKRENMDKNKDTKKAKNVVATGGTYRKFK